MSSKGHCDGCGKIRSDIKACGRDANGDPDAPDLCFICRREGQRGKVYNFKLQRYVHHSYQLGEAIAGEDYDEKDIPY